MKIICLKSYKSGYTGFLEERDRYVFFHLSRNGELKRLVEYDKSGYLDRKRFVSVMARYVPLGNFLEEPVPVEEVTVEALDKITKMGMNIRP
jgi:hypothetical protein